MFAGWVLVDYHMFCEKISEKLKIFYFSQIYMAKFIMPSAQKNKKFYLLYLFSETISWKSGLTFLSARIFLGPFLKKNVEILTL